MLKTFLARCLRCLANCQGQLIAGQRFLPDRHKIEKDAPVRAVREDVWSREWLIYFPSWLTSDKIRLFVDLSHSLFSGRSKLFHMHFMEIILVFYCVSHLMHL
jgi:hypothetical protein